MELTGVGEAFERVGIDVLGAFPQSRSGNRHIVVAIDYHTKWAETRALPTATTKGVANFFIEQVVLRHGTPRRVTTDQGRCFVSGVMKKVFDRLEVKQRTSTAFHQQANGLVERLNKTLATMISMYVDSNHSNWDEILPYITFAYNTSRQESTGRTPFFLVYGREAVLPIDVILNVNPNPPAAAKDLAYAEEMMQNL